MKRMPPSRRMRKEFEEVSDGVGSREFLLSEFIKKEASIIFQELLEHEVTDFLGRGHYERCKGESTGCRNGYEPFWIKTAGGKIEVY